MCVCVCACVCVCMCVCVYVCWCRGACGQRGRHRVHMCVCVGAGERVVNVGGTECMCGGTHVKNTADIGAFTATKIKKVQWTIIFN